MSSSLFAYRAEWTPHKACFLAWPAAEDLWDVDLKNAQKEFTGFCRAIAGEALYILVTDEKAEQDAKAALSDLKPKFFRIPYGDIWLRDIAPIFLKSSSEEVAAARFKFNGWGGKFILPHDDLVASRIGEAVTAEKIADCKFFSHDWILEGGSLEVDEYGSCLTTEQCLLNPNRNPGLSRSNIEERLKSDLGIKKTLWLKEGLLNDHTDGHIDTLARFAPGGRVLCMTARDPEDSNAKILKTIFSDLSAMTNAEGRSLEVIEVPSPGIIKDEGGNLMPASYMNFYISNESVIVPTYGSQFDNEAVELIGKVFSDRKTVGRPAKTILKGGGAFHCISQQLPK